MKTVAAGAADSYGLSGSLFTGLVIDGGEFKLGIHDKGGDAALLVKVDDSHVQSPVDGGDVRRYRIILGKSYAGPVEPGGATAFMTQPFREFPVGLKSEFAALQR